MSTSSPVKDPEQLRELKSLWEKTSKKYVLIDFMLNTGLRVSDVLSTKVELFYTVNILESSRKRKNQTDFS